MKKILVLTSTYPGKGFNDRATPVVHYFTRQWLAMGYNVQVVHNFAYYPKVFYPLINFFRNLIIKFFKYPRLHKKQHPEHRNYQIEGVNVDLLPIFKPWPTALFPQKVQVNHLDKIKDLLDTKNFTPDIIIGHWPNPQLFQVSKLGEVFPKAKTCMVLHNNVEIIEKVYKFNTSKLINSIDIWGFRSKNIKKRFLDLYGEPQESFICYSGIPENLVQPPNRTFDDGVEKFIFVGKLVPRKNPVKIVRAVNAAFEGENFHITFVGTGPKEKEIKKAVNQLGLSDQVTLKGKMSREKVFDLMRKSDCFVMLSKPETLGLVYLEAMSVGCITIGSKGEGIDGIIEYGKNGFLVDPEDNKEFIRLLEIIRTLNPKKLSQISDNAIKTMKNFTDRKVAKDYIDTVQKA